MKDNRTVCRSVVRRLGAERRRSPRALLFMSANRRATLIASPAASIFEATRFLRIGLRRLISKSAASPPGFY